jgi:RNA polymerase sigma factor (sigma-70 family)
MARPSFVKPYLSPAVKVSEIHSAPKDTTSGLSAVFAANRYALHRFLMARRARAEEAEDILQELFLKIGKLTPGPIADPLAYLYRIADNLLLDLRRSQTRRNVREQAWMAARHGSSELDDQPSAEDRLIAQERLRLVQLALSRLPERTVIVLRRFRLDGVGQKRIAAELGISVSAVEKHLQRAYRALLDARSELDAEIGATRRPIDEGH